MFFMMHPFPCSALLTCFGSGRESTPLDPQEPHCLAAGEVDSREKNSTVCGQPATKSTNVSHPQGLQVSGELFPHSLGREKNGSITANSDSSNHVVADLSIPVATDSSTFALEATGHDTVTVHTHIPRPSVIRVPKVSAGGCYHRHL